MTQPTDSFTCSCCKDEAPVEEASIDDQCGGPVCDHCRRLFIKAIAYMRHEGINRPFIADDINPTNCNRIKDFYK